MVARIASIAALFIFAAFGAAPGNSIASARQDPVVITKCEARPLDELRAQLFHIRGAFVYLGFRTDPQRTPTSVSFEIRVRGVAHGGTTVTEHLQAGANEIDFLDQEAADVDLNAIQCVVTSVTFDDGSSWHASPEPSPSPTATKPA